MNMRIRNWSELDNDAQQALLQRPAVADDARIREGTRDIVARVRADGGIRIVGRTKDIIIRGGENVPVAEVEAALYRHPKVAEVSVIGIPHDRLGEQACAFIAPEGEPPTLADLTQFLEELGMAKQFWPERLEIMADMPKTPSGKIQKFKLRELIEPR